MKSLDYTKLKQSKNHRIVKCPKCQRNGELHKYTTGEALIIHKSHIELSLFNQIDDSCWFKIGEYK